MILSIHLLRLRQLLTIGPSQSLILVPRKRENWKVISRKQRNGIHDSRNVSGKYLKMRRLTVLSDIPYGFGGILPILQSTMSASLIIRLTICLSCAPCFSCSAATENSFG